MKTYSVVFKRSSWPISNHCIADHGSPKIAERYTSAIIGYCEGIQAVPHRGTRRDDIRPGLRITHYKGRAIFAFAVEAERVSIIASSTAGRTTRERCARRATTERDAIPIDR